MFGDAWRTMKYRFYDPKMHGYDWDAMYSKYQPLVEFVGDRQELLNIVNEMIGELNASHTGAAAPLARAEGAVSTGHLGVDLEADETAGRYKVTHVYEEGPADRDWVKVKVGDYLIAIDGKPVSAGDNYWKLLNCLPLKMLKHLCQKSMMKHLLCDIEQNSYWLLKQQPNLR